MHPERTQGTVTVLALRGSEVDMAEANVADEAIEQTFRPVVLVCTVGGSPQPIATALRLLRPEVVWFHRIEEIRPRFERRLDRHMRQRSWTRPNSDSA
jgi:hypothetical protein